MLRTPRTQIRILLAWGLSILLSPAFAWAGHGNSGQENAPASNSGQSHAPASGNDNGRDHGPQGVSPEDGEGTICSITAAEEFDAQRILGGHVLYFSADAIKPFLSQNGQLADAQLWVLLEGRRGDLDQLTLSMNGISTQQANGRSHFQYSKTLGSGIVARGSLDELKLRGAEPAVSFIQRLFSQRGILTIWMRGPYRVKKAKLILGASMSGDCEPGSTVLINVPPQVSITSETPSASLTNQTGITFTFQSNQNNVTFQCSVDGATPSLCASPWALSGLASGAHQFSVTAVNAAGLSSTPATYAWTIDNTPPDVTITAEQPSATYTSSTDITVSFTSSKAGTTFQCALDSGAAAACASPATWAGLTDGQHTITVIGTDALGNVSSPATYTWTVDTIPPQVSIVQVTGADTYTNQTSPAFAFTANESASFQCSLDGQPYAPCQSPAAYAGLAEGVHQFSVEGTDAAGNVSAPATYSWTIDLTPPVVTLGNVVPAAGLTNSTNASVEFTVNETGATTTCSLDGAAPVPCASPYTFTFPSQGAHELAIVATDLAGNVSQPTLVDWTVDLTAPIVSFSSILPSASSYISTNWLTVTLVGSEPINYQAYLDGQLLPQTTGSTLQLTGLADGAHSLVVNAEDYAGNPATPLTHNFTVDTVPPTVSIASAQYAGPTTQTSNSFTFSASKVVQFYCNLDLTGYVPCTSPYAVSGLAEGTHTLQLYGTDLAGLSSTVVSYSWAIDLTPPKTTIGSATPSGAYINNTSISISFTVSEAATSYCSMDGAAAAACTSPYAAGPLANGSHTFQVYSVDTAGNKEATPASYSFSVNTVPPSVTVTGTPSTSDPSAMIFTLTSSETGTSFQCSMDGAAAVACTSPYTVSNFASGSHTISVTGKDLYGNVSQPADYTFSIQTAITTTITSITPSTTPTNQSSITFAFTSNVTNATFICSLDGAAFSACASPQSYTGLADGTHQFTVKAVSPNGSVDPTGASYSWTIDTVAPQILSITTSVTSTSVTIKWTTNVLTTGIVHWGVGSSTANVISDPVGYSTSHTVTITGLSPLTVYSYIVSGYDQAGNFYSTTSRAVRTAAQ